MTTAKTKKKPTYGDLLDLLIKARDKAFRYPNSDFYEYCSCGGNPHRVPQHEEGCLTVQINDAISAAKPKR